MFSLFLQNWAGNVELINFPSVCVNPPKAGSAFCSFHGEYVSQTRPDIPLTLREFLAFAGKYSS